MLVKENIDDLLKSKSQDEIQNSIENLYPSKILKLGVEKNDRSLIELAFKKATTLAELKPIIQEIISEEYTSKFYSNEFVSYVLKNDINIFLPIKYIFYSGLYNYDKKVLKYALDKGVKINDYHEFSRIKDILPLKDYKDNLSDKIKYEEGIKIDNENPNKLFSYALRRNNIKDMKRAIKKGATNTNISNNEAIVIAVQKRDKELLKLLLKNPNNDPSEGGIQEQRYGNRSSTNYDNAPIKIAAREGFDDIVKILLKDPRVDPTTANNYPFRHAYKNEHWEVVELLLNNNMVFRTLGIDKIQKVLKELIKMIKDE